MAPLPGGFLAALEAAPPNAAVLVVAHTGLEELVTLREIWQELPMGKTIVIGAWLTLVSELPVDEDARALWLFEQWERIDAWIEERTPAD
jgi:hypothetical protein